jgi:endo-1,4-beta-xylanase
MITEFEMNVLPEPMGIVGAEVSQSSGYQKNLNPWPESFPDSMQQVLADRYVAMFKVLLKNSDKISRVTFWGVHDGNSWKNNWPIPGRTNYPLLFDRNYGPKPAYDAVIDLVRMSAKQ